MIWGRLRRVEIQRVYELTGRLVDQLVGVFFGGGVPLATGHDDGLPVYH